MLLIVRFFHRRLIYALNGRYSVPVTGDRWIYPPGFGFESLPADESTTDIRGRVSSSWSLAYDSSAGRDMVSSSPQRIIRVVWPENWGGRVYASGSRATSCYNFSHDRTGRWFRFNRSGHYAQPTGNLHHVIRSISFFLFRSLKPLIRNQFSVIRNIGWNSHFFGKGLEVDLWVHLCFSYRAGCKIDACQTPTYVHSDICLSKLPTSELLRLGVALLGSLFHG